MLNGIEFDCPKITALFRRAGVVRAFLFGSILTDHFRGDSDIDMLIETDPARRPGLLALGELQMDLSEMMGRTIHITLLGGVPPHERPAVLARARMLDAA